MKWVGYKSNSKCRVLKLSGVKAYTQRGLSLCRNQIVSGSDLRLHLSLPLSFAPHLSMHLIMIIASFGSKIQIAEQLKNCI